MSHRAMAHKPALRQPRGVTVGHRDISHTQGHKRGTWDKSHGPGTSHPWRTVEGTATAASVSPDGARSRQHSPVTAAPSIAVTTPRTDEVAFAAPRAGTLIRYGFTIKEQSAAPGETEARRDAAGTCPAGGGHQSHPGGAGMGTRDRKGSPKTPGWPHPAVAASPARGMEGTRPVGTLRGATSPAGGDTIRPEGTREGASPSRRGRAPRSCPRCHPGQRRRGRGWWRWWRGCPPWRGRAVTPAGCGDTGGGSRPSGAGLRAALGGGSGPRSPPEPGPFTSPRSMRS